MHAAQPHRRYGVRRVYDTTPGADGTLALRLSDRVVDLGPREAHAYLTLAGWLPTGNTDAQLAAELDVDAAGLERIFGALERAGLLYRKTNIPPSVSGEAFHRDTFTPALPSWLGQAFSHPFW